MTEGKIFHVHRHSQTEFVGVHNDRRTGIEQSVKPGQPGPSPWTAGVDIDALDGSAPRAVKEAGGPTWAPYFKNLTPESLAEARRLGLRVSVWTTDSPDDLKRMIELKVDAITTNRPDVLKRLLDGR